MRKLPKFSSAHDRIDDRTGLVRVVGELDIYSSADLRKDLHVLINDGVQIVVADLSGVTFIDSTSLGVLIGARKRLRAHDGDIVLVVTDPNVKKVFDLTGLNLAFTITQSLEQALAVRISPVEHGADTAA